MSGITPPPPPSPTPPTSGSGGSANGVEAIGYGFRKFGENAGPFVIISVLGFVGLAVLYFVTGLVLSSIFTTTETYTYGEGFRSSGPGLFGTLIMVGIFAAIFFLGQSILQMFFIRGSLLIARGEKPESSNMLTFENFGNYLIASVLVSVFTGIGFVLCYIPGVVIAFLLSFTGYFVLDKQLNPINAIKASLDLVKDNIGSVLLFLVLAWLVTLGGAILCLVGLIVAIPVVVIGTGYMYKRLQGEPIAP